MFEKPHTEFTKHEFIKRDDPAQVAPASQKADDKPNTKVVPAPLNYPNRNNFIAPSSLGSAAPAAQRVWGTPYMPKEAHAAIEETAKKFAPPVLADKAPETALEPAGKTIPPMPRSFIEKLKSGMLR